MIISLLVAMDEKGGIGKDNHLPWRLSADLKRFKELTMGHYLIMGRKTYESIGRPLPGRTTIVITHQVDIPHSCQTPDCFIAHSADNAIALAEASRETEVFIIGGAEIFALTIARAERLYLTRVHTETQADVYFPHIDWDDWIKISTEDHPADEKNQYSFSFERWLRNSSSAKTGFLNLPITHG